MNKTDLIRSVADSAGVAISVSTKVVESLLEVICTNLKKGDKVQITGFGTFSTKKRKAREGVNPLTKKTIKIEAKTVCSFKTGQDLKNIINGVAPAKKKKK